MNRKRRLVIGTQDGIRVAYMVGRAHYYETGDPRCMAMPLETLALSGVHSVLLTATAGSVKGRVTRSCYTSRVIFAVRNSAPDMTSGS